LIPQGSKETVIEAIDTAVRAGARQTRACEIVGITPRTLQNWHRGGTEDKRKGAQKKRRAKAFLTRNGSRFSACVPVSDSRI
jgi:transposase-like protein